MNASDAYRALATPVFAGLGDHDLNRDRADELAAILADAGVRVLDRSSSIWEVAGPELCVVGAKGFV